MRRHLLGLAVLASLVACSTSQAAMFVSTADGNGADTFIENDNQGFDGTDPIATAANIRGGSEFLQMRRLPGVRLKAFLLRFDITDLDAAAYADAQLRFDFSLNRTRQLRVYAIADGALDNWDEATTNYLSAPGILDLNDTPAGPDAVAAEIGLNPTELFPGHLSGGGPNPFQVGSITTFDTRSLPGGRGILVSDSSSLNLAPVLNADTNGLVSFLVFLDSTDGAPIGDVRSKEGALLGGLAPLLGVIPQNLVPEPTTAVLAALGIVGLASSRRR